MKIWEILLFANLLSGLRDQRINNRVRTRGTSEKRYLRKFQYLEKGESSSPKSR